MVLINQIYQYHINDQLINIVSCGSGADQSDTIRFQAKASPKIKFLAKKNLRVFVKEISLTNNTQSPVSSLPGYPLRAGNVTSYDIAGLTANSDYYYKITPYIQDEAQTSSSENKVTTLFVNSVSKAYEEDNIIHFIENGKLTVLHAPYNAKIRILDLTRKNIFSFRAIQQSEEFNLHFKACIFLK